MWCSHKLRPFRGDNLQVRQCRCVIPLLRHRELIAERLRFYPGLLKVFFGSHLDHLLHVLMTGYHIHVKVSSAE